MPRYMVLVDDNFHYQEGDRREYGTYDSLDKALAACREVVDKSLVEEYRPDISAEALYDRYVSFGDDPFVAVVDGTDDSAEFSAWTYAKERCQAMCRP